MLHQNHTSMKHLENALRAAHNENLMSLHERLGLLKASVNEAVAFVTAGNMQQAASALAQLYYDCDETQKRIILIADKG